MSTHSRMQVIIVAEPQALRQNARKAYTGPTKQVGESGVLRMLWTAE